jgi:hypothetical protein
MKTIVRLFAFILIFSISMVYAQPTIEWQRCFGGSSNIGEYGYSILETANSGLVLAGYAGSNDGDVSGNHSSDNSDFWIVSINSSGEILWQKCLGGTRGDYGYSLDRTQDGGYIFGGNTDSNDGMVIGNHGDGGDVWIVKLTSNGSIQWKKCFGGTRGENCFSIKQTSDGGYIFAGTTTSNDGDVSGNHGDQFQVDGWVVKLSSVGAIQWQKCLGGSGSEGLNSIEQTTDGGYIVAGGTKSNNGDVSGNHGGYDAWVVKLSSTGSIQWQKCLGGTSDDGFKSIRKLIDGGYILVGGTNSINGDVSINYGLYDGWVVKLNSSGEIQWQNAIGGSAMDGFDAIYETSDGGCIVAGSSYSNGGIVAGNHGGGDAWVAKFSSTGSIQWQKCLGGTSFDAAHAIVELENNGYVVTGYTNSNDGDVSGNHGQIDVWVVKLSPVITESVAILAKPTSFQITPNPTSRNVNLKTEAALIGKDYQIFNAQGKKVMSGQISAEEMPLSTEGLPAGIYNILAAGQAARLVRE